MPQLAKKIVVDHNIKKVFVDGVEFPWLIGDDLPIRVDSDYVSTVYLPVMAESFESVGWDDGND